MTFVTTIERLETGLLIWIDNHKHRRTIKLIIQILRRPGRLVLLLAAVIILFWAIFGLIADCMVNSRQVAELQLIASAVVLSVMEAIQ